MKQMTLEEAITLRAISREEALSRQLFRAQAQINALTKEVDQLKSFLAQLNTNTEGLNDTKWPERQSFELPSPKPCEDVKG